LSSANHNPQQKQKAAEEAETKKEKKKKLGELMWSKAPQ